jgi:hypothetical protein
MNNTATGRSTLSESTFNGVEHLNVALEGRKDLTSPSQFTQIRQLTVVPMK